MKTLAILAVLSLSAFAGHGDYVQNETHAYWMKSYASADQAKINRCMGEGNAAYDKAVGLDWAPTLMKGNAWEACMDAK